MTYENEWIDDESNPAVPLWVIEYEGPTLQEDGWTHFRNPPKAREATPADLLAAVGGLATEPDLSAANRAAVMVYAKYEAFPQHFADGELPLLIAEAAVQAALAGRVVVPTEGTPDE